MCSGPNEGSEGNDLVQWSCSAPLHGLSVTATLDGSDSGVFDFAVAIPGSADLSIAREVFADVAGATAALADARGDVEAWLHAWSGSDATSRFGTARVHAERDETWMTLAVFMK